MRRRYYVKKMSLSRAIVQLPLLVAVLAFFQTGDLWTVLFLFTITGLSLISGYIFLKKGKLSKALQAGIAQIDEMKGEDFEKLLQAYFKKVGYKAETTLASGDYGADLVLKKGTIKIVVQAKRWNKNVGVSAIQEVTAAISFYNADRAIVITNSHFTSNAKKLASSNGIELWDRDVLIEKLSEINRRDLSTDMPGV